MIRKHTRRAAKAAFAVSLGVAIVLGGGAAAQAAPERAEATPIVIGTKNFPEQYVLGQLYKQALEARGFKVGYKENIGSTELIAKALTSGQITLYPEYTGVILSVTFGRKTTPKTSAGVYRTAKNLYGKRGYVLLRQTPFQDVDAVAVLRPTAARYGLRTVADLKKVPDLSLAGFPEFQTRNTGLVGLRRVYGITDVDFTPLANISAYQLLDQGDVLAAAIFSTDPQLISTKYVVLRDPKAVFGFQHVVPVVSRKLVQEYGTRFTATINRVSALLTVRAMIAMNKAVALDKKPAAQVARQFLRANKLL